jgi:DNA-binding GntR family transcriptional regulator
LKDKKPLRVMVYDYLYDAIISNKLGPGSVIVEQEISDSLGISRTPVREALKQLTAEGLVRQIDSVGTFVEDINSHDIEEMFELREIFEEVSLKSGIDEISGEELSDLERQFESLGPSSAPEDYYSCDRALHDLILKHGWNKRMALFLNTINSQLERLRRISAMTPNRLSKSTNEHLGILYAIKERDIDKAVALLHEHLENVKLSTLDVCKRSRFNR